jgi:hypothetical protein
MWQQTVAKHSGEQRRAAAHSPARLDLKFPGTIRDEDGLGVKHATRRIELGKRGEHTGGDNSVRLREADGGAAPTPASCCGRHRARGPEQLTWVASLPSREPPTALLVDREAVARGIEGGGWSSRVRPQAAALKMARVRGERIRA